MLNRRESPMPAAIAAKQRSSRRKKPFDIDVALKRVEKTVRSFPKAALFQLAEEGYGSPFEQLA